jgi:hypothetical protein
MITDLDAVECVYEPIPWPFADENRPAIEAHWARLLAAKPKLFNGRVLLLHRWAIEGGTFRGAYLDTDYASFLALRDLGFPDKGKRNCFSMAALQAADGAFLLGEMGAHTANAGAVYFAAGTPDLDDVVEGRVDLARSVTRELGEETGLDPATLVIAPGWTMVAQGPRIALMRRMVSPLASGDLARRIEAFLASETEPELARMHVVRSLDDVPADRMPPFQLAYLRHVLGGGAAPAARDRG